MTTAMSGLLAAMLAAALAGAPAAAQRVTLERDSPLYAEPRLESAQVTQLKEGAAGEVVGKQGGWLNLKAPGGTGWLFSFNVRFPVQETEGGEPGSGHALGRVFGPRRFGSVTSTIGIRGLVPVTADARERDVNQRQHNQQKRIHQGAQQGDLTRGEARQLQHQARDIRREERVFRSDGRFTPAERREVQRDLDRQSRDIRRERHDGDRRIGLDEHRYRAGSRPDYGRQNSTRAFDQRFDNAQYQQRQRIERGIRSGELTRREAARLTAEQRSIEAQERRYMADGVLTRVERADMSQDLNRAGRHIYNETHDAQARR